MRVASWLVATHFRPRLLRAALQSIRAQVYPAGWIGEILVAHQDNDPEAGVIAADLGATAVSTSATTGGGKRNAALKVATGELVLAADDDDYQSPGRAMAAIDAFERGAAISELREFRFLHLATGHVVRWNGRGNMQRPPVVVGTARNYRRSLLVRVGGWKSLPRLMDKDLQARISSRMSGPGARVHDLTTEALAAATICLQHDANIWDDRPQLLRGAEADRGRYRLVGEGHWSDAPSFPVAAAKHLELAG
jgi:hypothetical protein